MDYQDILKTLIEAEIINPYDIPEELLNEKKLVLPLVTFDSCAFKHISDELQDDDDVVMAAISGDDSTVIRFASSRLRNNFTMATMAVINNGQALEYLSEELKDNEKIVKFAVTNKGISLKYASKRLQKNRNIVMAAVSNNGYALGTIADKFKEDPDTWRDLMYDEEIALAAVTNSGKSLEFVCDEFKENRKIISAAVSQNGRALKYASPQFKEDREMVIKAITQDPSAFEFSFEDLRNDKELAVIAFAKIKSPVSSLEPPCKRRGMESPRQYQKLSSLDIITKSLSDNLKEDKEFMMFVATTNGLLLNYASKTLQDDEDVVEVAIANDIRSVAFASERLQKKYPSGK